MSRTYRNRNTVPHGWTVRDDGVAYHEKYPTKEAAEEHWRNWWAYERGRRHSCDCPDYYPPRFRRGWCCTERKSYRKAHYRQYRAKMKNLMRHGRWEDITPYRKTSGWLTW